MQDVSPFGWFANLLVEGVFLVFSLVTGWCRICKRAVHLALVDPDAPIIAGFAERLHQEQGLRATPLMRVGHRRSCDD